MKQADSRPRVHLWNSGPYWTYSLGAVAMRQGGGTSPGEQLDRALDNLGKKAAQSVVVIVEVGA
jgi:hypothetical protein